MPKLGRFIPRHLTISDFSPQRLHSYAPRAYGPRLPAPAVTYDPRDGWVRWTGDYVFTIIVQRSAPDRCARLECDESAVRRTVAGDRWKRRAGETV